MTLAPHPTAAELQQDLEQATKTANARAKEACEAADKAVAAGSTEARDHFLKLEQQALKAYDNWRQAAANLSQRLAAQ